MALIKMEGFKAWVQSALPTVYDDSLSYFELLSKVVYQLNSVITNYNDMVDYVENFTDITNETIQEYIAAYNTLKEFVDNYFNSLDVQEEINNKLDIMATDGTISDLINETIFDDLNDKINSVASGSPKGVFATLAALQAAYPTGNGNIYVVSDTGYWYYYSGGWQQGGVYQGVLLSDNSVIYEKIDRETLNKQFEGVNVLDNTIIFKGKYLENNNTLITSSTIALSDYVLLEPFQYYTFPNKSLQTGCFYDKDKNFVSDIYQHFIGSTSTVKVPSNVRYCIVNMNISDINNVLYYANYKIIKGKVYTELMKNYRFSGSVVGGNNILDKSIREKHIKTVNNLFDKTTVTQGYIDDLGDVQSSTTLAYSDYIPIDYKEVYTIKYLSSSPGVWYDENKNVITKIFGETGPIRSLIPPNNARFVRVNVNIADSNSVIAKDSFMFVNGFDYPNYYIPFNKISIPFMYGKYLPTESILNGKKVATFGDSITWYDGKQFGSAHSESPNYCIGYQSYLRDNGCVVSNYGVSGANLQGIYNTISTTNLDNLDYITITGGVNDWAQLIPLGDIAAIGSVFSNTTVGNLQKAIEYILNSSNKKVKILLISPLRAYFKPTSKSTLKGTELPKDYAIKFKEVASLYGIEFLDIYNEIGFNLLNFSYWYKDIGVLGDRYVHIGNEGYKRFGELLVPKMKNF